MPEYPRSPSLFEKDGTDISTKVANDAIKVDRLKPTINIETLAATRTLLTTDYLVQWLNPNGASRDVIFPAEASSTNLMFILLNDGSQATFNLVCKNDAAATIATLGPGMSGIFSCDGTTWKWEDKTGMYYDAVSGNVQIEGLLSQIGLGHSTYFGFEAGKVDNLSNNDNTGIGYQALLNVTTGYNNTAIGMQALQYNTTGHYNVAIGFAALNVNTTGCENIALGMNALRFNTTSYGNIALGLETLLYNTTGNDNIAVGKEALYYNTTGNDNVGVGKYTLENNDTGLRNIAIGSFAGRYELGSDSFYVNNQDRTTTANEKLTSIIYGIMAAAVADQRLVFNADVSISGIVKTPKTQTLTGAGAVDIVSAMTLIATTAADALTLVDGAVGQEKFLVMTSDGGAGTLTPTNLLNGTTITFDDVGDSAHLKFMSTGWVWMGGTATLA